MDNLQGRNIDDLALELGKKFIGDTAAENQENDTEETASSAKQNRSKLLQFRVSEEEFKIINERFEKSYSRTLSEYLRISALSCINISMNDDFFKEESRKISGIANNLNQIAARMNSTGRIYAEDVKEIKEEAERIWQLQISILSELHSVNQFSTSLTETKPETASLLLAVAVHLMHKLQQDNLSKSESAEQEEVPF